MSEDDLRVLLHSPALTLDPPEGLSERVRRRARRHRLRTRATGGVAVLALVAAGAAFGPGLATSVENLRSNANRSAGFPHDPRFPDATSEVVTLQLINKASVLTWFQGSRWCTATTRVTSHATCLGPVSPDHQGFSWVMPSGSPSVTVDTEHVVAGVAPPGAVRVGVHMKDGREYDAPLVDGARFLVQVWSARVDDSAFPVQYYVAYDSTGREIARQPA